MSEAGMNRRRFLATSGQAAAGAAVVASGGVTMLMAPDGAWAISIEAIGAEDAQVLLKTLRVIYPHDILADEYYAGVVEALDQEAKDSAETAALLKDGVAGLNAAYPVPFLELSEGYRLQAVKAIEDTPFFQKLRGKTIAVLYNDPRVWEAFGYEGPSFQDGGYIERGFNDLAWLPDPPEEASPPKA